MHCYGACINPIFLGYEMLPTVEPKLRRFGRISSSSLNAPTAGGIGLTPNQVAKVAAYWSTDVVGSKRP